MRDRLSLCSKLALKHRDPTDSSAGQRWTCFSVSQVTSSGFRADEPHIVYIDPLCIADLRPKAECLTDCFVQEAPSLARRTCTQSNTSSAFKMSSQDLGTTPATSAGPADKHRNPTATSRARKDEPAFLFHRSKVAGPAQGRQLFSHIGAHGCVAEAR